MGISSTPGQSATSQTRRFQKYRREYEKLRLVLGVGFGWRSIRLLFMLTFAALLETVSFGAFFPLISLLADAEAAQSAWWFDSVEIITGPLEINTLILLLLVAILVLLASTSIFRAYTTYTRYKLAMELIVSLSHRVLQGYLNQNYLFFLSRNSSVLTKNITTETMNLSLFGFLYTFEAISRLLLAGSLSVLLLFVNPLVNGLVIFFAVFSTGGIYVALRPYIKRWGRAREAQFGEANRLAHQALTGIKDVKAFGSESYYTKRFLEAFGDYAKHNARHQVVAVLISQLAFVMITIALAGVVAFALLTRVSFVNLLASLAPFIMVAFIGIYRIMPAFAAGLSTVATVMYYWPTYDALEEGILGYEQTPGQEQIPEEPLPPFSQELSFREVGFHYPDNSGAALERISLTIPFGQVVAFVGASGAGKTTAIDLILGLLEPASGSILVDGQHLNPRNYRSWQRQIGYVPQQAFIADASFEENIALGIAREDIDRGRLNDAIQRAGLQSVLDKLPQGQDTPLSEHGARLSGGERQRVSIARALYRQPRLLVLDEATSALDNLIEGEILVDVMALREEMTIIIVSHRLNSLQDCDHLFVLEHGSLVGQGSYQELLHQSEQFAGLGREFVSTAPYGIATKNSG